MIENSDLIAAKATFESRSLQEKAHTRFFFGEIGVGFACFE